MPSGREPTRPRNEAEEKALFEQWDVGRAEARRESARADREEASSPPIGRKPGRPRDKALDHFRQNKSFRRMSERSQARFMRGVRLAWTAEKLRIIPSADNLIEATLKAASRPNGTLNVSRFMESVEQSVGPALVAAVKAHRARKRRS